MLTACYKRLFGVINNALDDYLDIYDMKHTSYNDNNVIVRVDRIPTTPAFCGNMKVFHSQTFKFK